jgi:hypothetical protein
VTCFTLETTLRYFLKGFKHGLIPDFFFVTLVLLGTVLFDYTNLFGYMCVISTTSVYSFGPLYPLIKCNVICAGVSWTLAVRTLISMILRALSAHNDTLPVPVSLQVEWVLQVIIPFCTLMVQE